MPLKLPEFVCVEIPEIPDPLKLILPGGISIEHLNLIEIIQPLLAPLVPFFNIIDTVVAIFNCIKAVPEVVTNPTALAECFGDLGKQLAKLLSMVPQLSLPLLIIGLIDLLIYTLQQAKSELMHLQTQMTQIMQAIDRAKDLDDAGLMAIAQCAQANVAQEAANVGKSLAALGKLIGLINIFLGMVGAPEIPDFSDLAGRPLDDLLEPINALVKTLKSVRKAIPVP